MIGNEDVIRCLRETGLLDPGDTITSDESLFDRGIIDSLGMTMLIPALESRFGISVPETDLLPSNFDSVVSIAQYVNSRRKQSATR